MKYVVGKGIEELRRELAVSQTEFGKLFDVSAMAISRWERDVNLPSARELIKLGLLANKAGFNGWVYWELAGIRRADARAMLGLQTRAAAVGI